MLTIRFQMLIGADESLEMAIKQAKAAVLYPPRGLHTLLTDQQELARLCLPN